jgi:hypothetical protein
MPEETNQPGSLKTYRVTEFYPQALVRRVMVVRAPDAEKARIDPHACEIVESAYDIDEGGEACTESVEEVS